jgi:hypothetical protein
MISIKNVGKAQFGRRERAEQGYQGSCAYELRINGDLKCSFIHTRSDGLAKLLLIAAEAAKNIEGYK